MREIRLYGSEGGGMSNHLSLPLSGQSLRARKAGLRGLWHTPPATPSFKVENTWERLN